MDDLKRRAILAGIRQIQQQLFHLTAHVQATEIDTDDIDPTDYSVPQLGRIEDAIRSAERPLSVIEIAAATRIDPGAVRATLYGRKDLFRRSRERPRPVLWELIETNTEAHARNNGELLAI